MVTVVVVGLIAALATPGIRHRVDSYRTRSAAENIATTYRLARMRAMGRGGAVLVRYTGTSLEVREGIIGGATGCATLPESGCDRPWNGTGRDQLVESFNTTAAGMFSTTFAGGGLASTSAVDICYSPSGRALIRGDTTAFSASNVMTAAAQITVTSSSGGLIRKVLLVPNGTARVVAEAP